jgi:glutamine amidotransferase
MAQVTIVDYGLANIRSVVNAFEYFGADVTVASEGAQLAGAERIVVPGVGSFDAGMRGLRDRGHEAALQEAVLGKGVPFLGICLGMQFVMEGSAEGAERGLGWFKTRCKRFPEGPATPPVPHIGWNDVEIGTAARLFDGLDKSANFYFVHSYFVPCGEATSPYAAGECDYGVKFLAAIERDNIWACQFHPEKSQMAGMKIIENFLTKTE